MPHPADCYAHCQQAFQAEPDRKTTTDEEAKQYGFGCLSHCIVQLSDRAGIPCYEVMAAESSGEWQELYLARGLVEKAALCIQEVGDTSAAGLALLSAVRAEHQTSECKKAMAEERAALLSGDAGDARSARKARKIANSSPEWQLALSAFQGWNAPEELAGRMLSCLDALPLRVCGQAVP